jgi:hypothetical protein
VIPTPLSLEERETILRRVLAADLNGINIGSICGEYHCDCHAEVARWEATVIALEARVAELENVRADTAPSGAGEEQPMTD